ncbi:hypothetical protein ACN28S_67410 [Cystobacter fuscus]
MSKPSVSGGSVGGMDERAQPQLPPGEVVSGLVVEELVALAASPRCTGRGARAVRRTP